jgi:hypothetical protein
MVQGHLRFKVTGGVFNCRCCSAADKELETAATTAAVCPYGAPPL